jgi:epoxyqueuosine reductase
MDLTKRVKEVALNSGLDLVGISHADSFKEFRWQDSIMRDPKLSVADALSIVVVAQCDLKKLKKSDNEGLTGYIARSYAAGHEFNLVNELLPIKKILEDHGYHSEISPGSIALSSLPLKLAATRAGLGWQGKHSLVISKEYGSWISFGGLITNAPLEYDIPVTNKNCGRCSICIDNCPTVAIKEPYIVDMSLCLDEILNTPDFISDEIKNKIGNRIISCDICQEVCPHSFKILKKNFYNGSNSNIVDLLEMLNLNEEEFANKFGKLNWSIDIITFKRNIIIALGNSCDKSALEKLQEYTHHENDILRSTSLWAIKKLSN